MSYVISIKRPPGKPPLTLRDFEELMREDASLSRNEGGQIVWFDSKTQKELCIKTENDHLWTDGIRGNHIDHALGKLRGIANRLDARVFGEEGEDITEVDATGPVSAKQTLAGLFIFIVSLPFLVLLFLIRLPWMFWKIKRKLK